VVGRRQGATFKARGPALLLMGGGADVVEGFREAHRLLAAGRGGRSADVVVLRTSGENGYDAFLHQEAPFASVQTLLLSPEAGPKDLARAAERVRGAHFVFFAGGDQAEYVRWAGTPLADAVRDVYARGGAVGGTSAGGAILGQVAFDSLQARTRNVTTAEALQNPLAERLSFTQDMFAFLPNVLTDTHFEQRDRFGRLVAFLANRQLTHGAAPLGIGVDPATALVVNDRRSAVLMKSPDRSGSAYVVELKEIHRPAPLRATVAVHRLSQGGQTYDLGARRGTGDRYDITVDGAQEEPYSANPYVTDRSRG